MHVTVYFLADVLVAPCVVLGSTDGHRRDRCRRSRVVVVGGRVVVSVVDDSDPLLGELAQVPVATDGLLASIAAVPDPRPCMRETPTGWPGSWRSRLQRRWPGRGRSWRSPNGPPTPPHRYWPASALRGAAMRVNHPALPAALGPRSPGPADRTVDVAAHQPSSSTNSGKPMQSMESRPRH